MHSQEELANLSDAHYIRISIATIERVETWHPVRYQIAREDDNIIDKRLTEAMRETLLHVAGVSGAVAKGLRPGQSLNADLGLDDVNLEVLAGCQHRGQLVTERRPGIIVKLCLPAIPATRFARNRATASRRSPKNRFLSLTAVANTDNTASR